jgi:hypothetical protein
MLYTLSSTFRAYKKERLPLAAQMRHNTFSTTVLLLSCSRVSLSQSSAREVLGELASRTTVCIATPARVCGRSGFWERLCDCLLLPDDCRRRLLPWIVYFSVDVQGTALGTSSCIHCGTLLRATHAVDSCEWSHQCLEHGSLHWVYF